MISPSTPAAPAGIVVGTGPSTRTVVAAGPRPGVLSTFASTTHDPPRTAVGVTGTSPGPVGGQAASFRVVPSASSTVPRNISAQAFQL